MLELRRHSRRPSHPGRQGIPRQQSQPKMLRPGCTKWIAWGGEINGLGFSLHCHNKLESAESYYYVLTLTAGEASRQVLAQSVARSKRARDSSRKLRLAPRTPKVLHGVTVMA